MTLAEVNGLTVTVIRGATYCTAGDGTGGLSLLAKAWKVTIAERSWSGAWRRRRSARRKAANDWAEAGLDGLAADFDRPRLVLVSARWVLLPGEGTCVCDRRVAGTWHFAISFRSAHRKPRLPRRVESPLHSRACPMHACCAVHSATVLCIQ